MKSTFSMEWGTSVQRRKQRKFRYNAPYHVKSKFLHVHLDASLRTKYGTRALRVRKGDTVKVLRGQHKGKSGKVERIDLHTARVYVAGVENPKRDGSKSLIPLQPSNLLLQTLNLSDKERAKKVEGNKTKKVEKEKQ